MTDTDRGKLMVRSAIGMNLLFCIMGANSCVTAEVREQQASARRISGHLDSLSSIGEHGYHVAYFLVGRFKNSPMERSTFPISVTRMDDRLLERAIRFRVVDALTYQLTYSLDHSETVLIGYFDQELDTDLFQILIARPPSSDSASLERSMKNASYIDHELRVYRY